MWKKTGAWFYKGIPKYEVPQRSSNPRAPQRQTETIVEKPIKCRIQCVDTSSEEDELDALSRDRPSSCKYWIIKDIFLNFLVCV